MKHDPKSGRTKCPECNGEGETNDRFATCCGRCYGTGDEPTPEEIERFGGEDWRRTWITKEKPAPRPPPPLGPPPGACIECKGSRKHPSGMRAGKDCLRCLATGKEPSQEELAQREKAARDAYGLSSPDVERIRQADRALLTTDDATCSACNGSGRKRTQKGKPMVCYLCQGSCREPTEEEMEARNRALRATLGLLDGDALPALALTAPDQGQEVDILPEDQARKRAQTLAAAQRALADARAHHGPTDPLLRQRAQTMAASAQRAAAQFADQGPVSPREVALAQAQHPLLPPAIRLVQDATGAANSVIRQTSETEWEAVLEAPDRALAGRADSPFGALRVLLGWLLSGAHWGPTPFLSARQVYEALDKDLAAGQAPHKAATAFEPSAGNVIPLRPRGSRNPPEGA